MATPAQTLVTRAEFSSTPVGLNMRKAVTFDGDVLEIGDTGLRDMSGSLNMTHLESGRLLLSREGRSVSLWLVDIILKATAPSSVTLLNQARPNTGSFFPPYAATGRAVAAVGSGSAVNGPGADVFINPSLGVVLHGAATGVSYKASLGWKTSAAWPASLPGVADGTPIGV